MIPAGVKVFLGTTPCDMLEQARGLTALVEGELGGSRYFVDVWGEG